MKKSKLDGSLIIEKLPGYFLIACLIAVMAYLFYILRPIITPIFIAAILVIAFFPIYKKMEKLLRGHNRIASFFACLFVLLIIVIPITVFILLVLGEGASAYDVIKERILSGDFDDYLYWGEGGFIFDGIEKLKMHLDGVVELERLDLKQMILDSAQAVSTYLSDAAFIFMETIFSFILGIFVMFFSMYYFFKDGKTIVEKLGFISPLPSVYEEELFSKIASMVKAVVFGVFFAAAIQGFAGGVGFAIVGISNPVFWGAVMGFLSLLPVFGTGIVWAPASIILLIMGDYWQAAFLLLWGILLVGSLDNIARTYLIGAKAKTYPLMTFFVVLGGVLTMGLKGVIVGPLILMILVSFLHIYEAEYSRVLKR